MSSGPLSPVLFMSDTPAGFCRLSLLYFHDLQADYTKMWPFVFSFLLVLHYNYSFHFLFSVISSISRYVVVFFCLFLMENLFIYFYKFDTKCVLEVLEGVSDLALVKPVFFF